MQFQKNHIQICHLIQIGCFKVRVLPVFTRYIGLSFVILKQYVADDSINGIYEHINCALQRNRCRS